MPTFDSLIDRTGSEALIPEDVTKEILAEVPEGSFVLKLARRLPNMTKAQRRLPVLNSLPQAYFVGEAGRTGQTFNEVKQTTAIEWANKYINAEEIACIVPIPETVLEDTDYDVWGEIRPLIVDAIGAVVDTAVLYGTSDVDVPVAWPDGILVQMPAAHLVSDTFGDDLYDAILSEGGVYSKVEEDGYFVNGNLAALSMRAKLRGLRDQNGQPIFVQDMHQAIPYTLDGTRLEFPTNGAFDPTQTLLLSGDWNKLLYAIRRDITYKMLTEGVITDNSTPRQIIHNLAQDDMVALRVTFRMGWVLPNLLNRVQPVEADRFPFAALVPAGS